MKQIPTVGMRELRDRLAHYLNGDTPLAIVRHGHTIGYFVPATASENTLERETLAQATTTLTELLEQHSTVIKEQASEEI